MSGPDDFEAPFTPTAPFVSTAKWRGQLIADQRLLGAPVLTCSHLGPEHAGTCYRAAG